MARRLYVPNSYSRRDFLKLGGLALVAAACSSDSADTTTTAPGTTAATTTTAASTTTTTFVEPTTKLGGDLKILLWSHFVPQFDKWFDPFAKNWGELVGVNVTVDHINQADIPATATAEIAAGEGHDMIEFIFPPAAFEPSAISLNDLMDEATSRFGAQLPVAQQSTWNPTTENYFAFSHGWVPDPGDYRKSMWEKAGFPNGPATWDDLLEGGKAVVAGSGVHMGIGMSQEIDSNMAGRALLWSFGASVQDANENVVINSPEAVAAVEFMSTLFKETMTEEVFAWNAASNNQGLVAGELSYILNSISAYRTAQEVNPEIGDDIWFTPALEGPAGAFAAEHVMTGYIIPKHAKNVDAAQEFLLHLVANYNEATFNSKLYNFPSFPDTVPQLATGDPDNPGWIERDPFGSRPSDKLAFLKDAKDWSVAIGYPGPASTAALDVFGSFIIPNMFAKAARGELSPADAVADAEKQIIPIFDKWRAEGLIGGGS